MSVLSSFEAGDVHADCSSSVLNVDADSTGATVDDVETY